jgi:hypothetical protein
MATDISAFAEEGFDPVSWVNSLCGSKPSEESLERFLAEMEMRLQLAAEEVEAGLQDSSAQAMRRIPYCLQEIFILQVSGGVRCKHRTLSSAYCTSLSCIHTATQPRV